ncbi:sugar isomerase domain-containing protein [Propionibacteriaceae bacterium Y1923]|uniref:sugar isomerase domain-containing protein n=1 Tax=Aestuariimicrobium sp. Y1814 TaxID=3418742 RepID=UPI003C260F6E
MNAEQVATDILTGYLLAVVEHLDGIRASQAGAVARAGQLVAGKVLADELVHVYGPGGHSNLAAQEVFFRAGGLANISALLDEGTLLSSGALRSMAMERTPGYATVVMQDNLRPGDLLVLVNAYGINTALIEAARWCREHGVTTIGISSRVHAENTAADHPARHPDGGNLHDLVDVHVDTRVPIGDALVQVDGVGERTGAVSTFANAYAINAVMATAIAIVAEQGHEPTIWRSGNAPGGDEHMAGFIERYRRRVRWL